MCGFEKLIRKTCITLFSLVIVFLSVHSLFFTSEIKSNETMKYLTDNFVVHFLVIVILLLLALYVKRKGWPQSEMSENRFILVIMLIETTISILCVLISISLPIFDQQLCISTANALISGNLNESVMSYYLNYFPFQLPWVLFLSVFSLLCDIENVMVYQFANVFANLISIWALAECGTMIFNNRRVRLLTWMGALAFLPLMFYVPFVYGNLIGLCLMLLGARMLILYLREHKAKHLISTIVFFTLASLIKKNFMIAAVAAFLLLIMDALRSKQVITLFTAILLLLASFYGNSVLLRFTNTITGADLTQGFPMSSFIMLGLQEEEGREPGWYNDNGYETYRKANFSTELADEMSRRSIQERLAVFLADPAYAASFFYRKMISQWDEPSFQSLWVNEMARNPKRGALALSIYEHGKAGKVTLWWMNQYHSIILVGVVLWLILCVRNMNIGALFFPLYFIGGCLFHLVWEAKGQYTIFYFFCIIPYAISGYLAFIQLLNSTLHRRCKNYCDLNCPHKDFKRPSDLT